MTDWEKRVLCCSQIQLLMSKKTHFVSIQMSHSFPVKWSEGMVARLCQFLEWCDEMFFQSVDTPALGNKTAVLHRKGTRHWCADVLNTNIVFYPWTVWFPHISLRTLSDVSLSHTFFWRVGFSINHYHVGLRTVYYGKQTGPLWTRLSASLSLCSSSQSAGLSESLSALIFPFAL